MKRAKDNHTKQVNFRRSKELADNLLLIEETIYRKTGIRPTTTAVLEMAVKNEAARWTTVGEMEVPAPLQIKQVKP
ncbi:hypothetical protein DYH09_35060 [bacterium CPR1]|nr:hypothetical protein [bacterium CPR1]